MRRFQFRLQSILDMREHTEDQRRLELGAITSRCAELERERDERRQRAHAVLAQSVTDGSDAQWLDARRANIAFAARLEAEAERIERERESVEAERLVAVDRYRDARRDAEVLRKLRERRFETYRRERTREEQKNLDEVAQVMQRAGGTNGNAL